MSISSFIFDVFTPLHSVHRLSFIQIHNNVIRLNNASEAHQHLIRNEIVIEQIITMFQLVAMHT